MISALRFHDLPCLEVKKDNFFFFNNSVCRKMLDRKMHDSFEIFKAFLELVFDPIFYIKE